MSYNYQYQQPEQTYHHGSLYGPNSPASAGGSYQLGAQPGYNAIPYGSTGAQGGGVTYGTSVNASVQNPQYANGYGGQQTYDPNYAAYYAGSSSAPTGTDAYSGLATTQATMAQATSPVASGYSSGQSSYYSSGISPSPTSTYGSASSAPSLHPSQTTPKDYAYGASYSGSVRSASGGMEGYAPYPTTQSPAELHQSSPYASTYPSSGDSITSTATALGSVAGMPIPLGSTTAGAPGTEGENCLIM